MNEFGISLFIALQWLMTLYVLIEFLDDRRKH
jgi:hypothetical protein